MLTVGHSPQFVAVLAGIRAPSLDSRRLRTRRDGALLGVWAYYCLVPSAIAAIAELLTPPRKRAAKKAR